MNVALVYLWPYYTRDAIWTCHRCSNVNIYYFLQFQSCLDKLIKQIIEQCNDWWCLVSISGAKNTSIPF